MQTIRRFLLTLGGSQFVTATRSATRPAGGSRGHELREQTPTSEILAHADNMRDARRWVDAAIAYRQVVEREPELAPIWVQLGHALKESENPIEAEAAYRKAIHLAPDVAENHLQLGHLLKVTGRRQEAIRAFTQAVRIDPAFRPAVAELTALGGRPEIRNSTSHVSLFLHETLATLDEMRRSLAAIDAQLPTLASLAAIPIDHYDAFRRKFSVNLPPDTGRDTGALFSVVVLDLLSENSVSDIMHLCHSLERQTLSPERIKFITTRQENAACFDRIRGASRLPAEPASIVGSCREAWQQIDWTAPTSPNEWTLIISGNIALHPAALAWFSFATSFEAVALYADEDHVSVRADGQNQFGSPLFKTAFDPLLLEQNETYGDVVAIRRDMIKVVLPHVLEEAAKPAQHTGTPVGVLLRYVAELGPVGHIPRVLSSRLSSIEGPKPHAAHADPATKGMSVRHSDRICIVLPTRNHQSLLRKCIDSLNAKACHSDRLDFVIVDNGSEDADTLSYLDRLQRSGAAHVIRDDRPFNWALFNNTAVASSDAALFLFCNNDIEMLSGNWDQRIEAALSEPNVGAIGAKLLYPDGTVQHAGIIFGPNGRSEHEGVNQSADAPGPQGRWICRRRAGAVTGAFLACRAEVFRNAGGFDAFELPIWFGDVDFCLRLRARGLHILFDPAIRAVHHESKTVRSLLSDHNTDQYWRHALEIMHKRWGRAMLDDPGFNPHFSRWDPPFSSVAEPSLDAIIRHLSRSANPNPWRV